MDDDFNTPEAFAILFNFIKEINKKGGGKKAYKLILEIDDIFNIFDLKEIKIPKKIKDLIKEREKARRNRDFKEADMIRDIIKKEGYILEDSEKGPIIKRL